ncbi:hypothetical protein SCYAM73S_03245 [Streptomyces cyaneofuscatus]
MAHSPQPPPGGAAHTGPAPSLTGPASDVHPVLRRTTAPPAALDLLAQARPDWTRPPSWKRRTSGTRRPISPPCAPRAAVLAARGRPETTPAGRARIRSAWEVLPEIAPELAEWSALFASGARRRARAEAGIQGAAGRRDADDLIRDVAMFLRLVERMLGPPAGPAPAPPGRGRPGPRAARPRRARGHPGPRPAGRRVSAGARAGARLRAAAEAIGWEYA